ncbi:uncharacterized protein DSM5745_11344 [Aspergillus mulundensis]|uniref:Uncharacterized protein n=1 Tax=Aspergillus mulundensis TaxID=1810919 RepID=A0A3D8Q944_9EURO|nr:hypothetical protein DSM5745_11344 [Aspergillus mulundensis]RDW57964.1 hypothetical protein DSM5745_11344 [Aspergillus mulundensis]
MDPLKVNDASRNAFLPPFGANPLIDLAVSHPTDRSEHRLSISSGISGKLRRRFSRDARQLHRQPKKSDRGPLIPFLHSSKHPGSHAAQVTSHELGGSLVSERGYDSDAQYIGTPKHQVYTAEHRPGNGIGVSPHRQPPPLPEPGLEPSREHTFGLTVDTKGVGYEQPVHHGEGGESQLLWPSRDHEHQPPHAVQESPSTSFQNVELGSPLGTLRNEPSSPCSSGTRAWAQERPSPMQAPAPVVRAQDMHRPHSPPAPTGSPMPIADSLEESASQGSGSGRNTGAMVYPTLHAQQPQGYATSAESVSGCPPQIAVRKRHQRPQRALITHGEQSVHLGEMNIHRMLASSGSTTYIQTQSNPFDENRSTSNAMLWNPNKYGTLNSPPMPPIWDVAEAKLSELPGSIQDPRSPYSPKTSISSAGLDQDESNIPSFSQGSSGNLPARRTYLPSDYAAISATTAEEAHALKSKFTERFGSDRSIGHAGVGSHGGDNSSSRRISIGWMSEGRRIGYGYTLVPPENPSELPDQMHYGHAGPGGCGATDSPNGSPAGSITGNSVKQRSPLAAETNRGPLKANRSSFDISAILQRLGFPRWAGSNSTLKPSNNSDAASCDSGGSSMFGILTNKKKPHAGPNLDAENPWEFCSWVRPSQSSGGQQAPHQGSVGSSEHAEAQLIEKLATLRRRGGAWAAKRKVSELARNLEKRADRAVANIAASDRFPVAQRTATRVLKLRAPASKERPREMHNHDPAYSRHQLDGHHDFQSPQARPPVRTSTGSSGDWDSLYEECLEECSIPE